MLPRLHALTFAAVVAGCGAPGDSLPADASADAPDADRSHDGAPGDAAFADAATPDAPPADAAPDAGAGDPLPPIERRQAGGETAAVTIVGDRAFVGVGPRLTLWDLSSGPPSRIAETEPLTGVVTGVAVAGDLAFVITEAYGDGAFHVIDVADETAPAELASLRLGVGAYSSPRAIVGDGATVYVADAEQGVFRVDVTAPADPTVTAHQPAFGATDLQLAGTRLHAAGVGIFGARVDTFDATDDLAPLGTTHIQGAAAAALTRDGLILTRSSTGFAVDDLADPETPTRIYAAQLPVWAMVPGAGGAWLTIDGRPRFLDLGDRSAIELGPPSSELVWAVRAASFAGDRLAFATIQGRLEAFAIDGAAATLLGRVATGPCASCYAATRAGDLVVIAETTPGAVATIGTTGLGALELGGQHVQLTADFEDVAHADGRAYVADWFAGVRVFDVTDPAHPTPTAFVPTGGYPSSIAIANDRVYVGERTNGGALRVLSLGAAQDPVELGAIATGQVADLAAAGDLVYVAEAASDGPGGLRIYDAQDPAAITPVGLAAACTHPRGVAVTGDVALLSCGDAVHVIDVSDPASPVTLAAWTPPSAGGTAGVVASDGRLGYVGHDAGVIVFDLSNPTSPVTVTELGTAWPVRHLAVAGPGRVIASTARAGVYQWQEGSDPDGI